MLTKVLKYDINASGKALIPLYIMVITLCMVTRIIYIGVDISSVFAILSFITNIFGLFSVLVLIFMTFYVCFRRFYHTIYKDEGYLTNVLPVKRNNLIISKLINVFIFSIISILISMASIYIMYFKIELVEALTYTLKELRPFLFHMIALVILQFNLTYMLCCSAYAIGQSRNNKTIVALVTGFIIYILFQLINLIILFIFTKINPDILTLINNFDLLAVKSLLCTIISITIIYIIILYFLLIIIYKNKFNLE